MDAVALRDFLFWLAREKGLGIDIVAHHGGGEIIATDVLPLVESQIHQFVGDYIHAHPMGALTDVRDCQSIDGIRRWVTTHPGHILETPFRQMLEDLEIDEDCYTLADFVEEAHTQVFRRGGSFE